MTAEVEQRIVEMRFDNEQFEKGAKQTLVTLEKLEGALDILGATGAIDKLGSALDAMEWRFSRFGVAGAAAIERITGRVMTLASNLLSAIPNQIIQGGTQRAMNIEQAQFQLKGLGVAWDDVSESINHAVDGTAYGLDEAAKAAAQLAASNKALLTTKTQLDGEEKAVTDMGRVLRSISGMAAMTNSTYDEIAHIVTGVFGTGHVMTADLRMLEGRGLNVAAKLAEVLRETGNGAQHTEEEIRDLVSKGKIDALTFAKAMDAAFGEHATAANETYTGSLRNMKAALSRIGADIVAPVHEAERKVFLGLRTAFNNVRKITKPFAEGKFAQVIEARSEKLAKIFENWDFTWLKRIIDFFETSNVWLKPIDWAIDRLGDLNDLSKKIFDGYLTGKLPTIKKFFSTAVDLLGTVYKNAKKNGESLIKLGGSLFELFTTIFKKIFSGKGSSEPLQNFKDSLNRISDSSVSVIDKLTAFVDKLTEIIEKGPQAGDVLDIAFGSFSTIGKVIGGAIEAVGSFLRFILGIKDGESILERFGEIASNVGGIIKVVFSNIRDYLKDAFGEGGVGEDAIEIAAALYTVLLGYRQLETKEFQMGRLSRAFEFLKDLLTKTYEGLRAFSPKQWADDIETLLRKTAVALRAFSDNLNAKSLLTIAGAVIALAFGLTILAGVAEGDHLGPALMALTAVMGLLVGALAAIKAITSQGLLKDIAKGWKGLIDVFKNGITKYFDAIALKETATALLLFAAGVAVLAIAVGILAYAFNKFEPGDVWQAVGALVILTAVLVGVIWALTEFTKEAGMLDAAKYAGIAIALVAIAVAIDLLVLGLIGLSFAVDKLGGGKLWNAIGMIATLAVILGGITVALSYFASPFVIFAAASLAAVAVAIDLLVLGLVALGLAIDKIGGDKLWNAIGMIAVLAVILGGVTVALSWFASPLALLSSLALVAIAVAIDILVAGLIILGTAVDKIGGNKLWNAIGMIATLAVIFSALLTTISFLSPMLVIAAGAFQTFANGAKTLTEGFVNISKGILNLAIALNMLPDNMETLGSGLGSVAKGLAGVALATLLMPKKTSNVYEAFIPMATALSILDDVDIAKLVNKDTGLPALAKALKSFGSWFFGIGSVGQVLINGNAGLLASGPALASLGEGLVGLSSGLIGFNDVKNPEKIADYLKQISEAARQLVYPASGLGGLTAMAINIEKIVTSVNGLMPSRVTLLRDLSSAISEGFSGDSSGAIASLANALDQMVQTTSNKLVIFVSLGGTISINIQRGITEKTNEPVRALTTLLQTMSNTANNETYRHNWYVVGGNIAIGIANGISSRTGVAVSAMTQLANSLQRSFTTSLDIHSPSRVFEHLSEFVPIGAAKGIQNGTPAVVQAIDNMVSIMESRMDAAKNSSADFTPQITPVMDLANYRSSMAYANRMMQNSPISSLSGISGLRINGDSISYNMQNKDIIDELKHLDKRIGQLGEAFESMQMVLDTGILVGQMAPGLNEELGAITIRERRQ